MRAVHIRTEGLTDEYESTLLEMFIRLFKGVKDVASVRTLHLVSILYDETVADIADILSSISRAGFRAYPYEWGPKALPAAL